MSGTVIVFSATWMSCLWHIFYTASALSIWLVPVYGASYEIILEDAWGRLPWRGRNSTSTLHQQILDQLKGCIARNIKRLSAGSGGANFRMALFAYEDQRQRLVCKIGHID